MASYEDLITDGNEAISAHIKAVMPPIGTILPWAKSFTGVPSIPDGYLECDGSAISDSDSPLNGETLPDLNGGTYRMLRGATTSGGTGGDDTWDHGHVVTQGQEINDNGAKPVSTSAAWGTTVNILPPYYEVVFIMRIK